MKRLLLLTAILAASLSHADQVDDLIRQSMEKDQIPGAALAIIRPDSAPEIRVYGIANVEHQSPVTQETVFRWASLTKQFTSMSVHILAKEGKINLDAPIRTYFPELPAHWEPVKVIHLLTHTSGIPGTGAGLPLTRALPLEEYFQAIGKDPLLWSPGEKYGYNNGGYVILGALVAKVSGMSFPEFVQANILDPAGMKTARFVRPADIIPHRSGGYDLRGSRLVNEDDSRPPLFDGSGGLCGSILDLIAWDAWLRKGGPGMDILEQMRTRPTLGDGSLSTYGRGWTIREAEGELLNTHSGSTPGFTSMMIRDLKRGITVLLLRNSDVNPANSLGLEIHRLVTTQPRSGRQAFLAGR